MIDEHTYFMKLLSDHLAGRKSENIVNADWTMIASLAKAHQVEGVVFYQCKGSMPIEVFSLFERKFGASLYYYKNREEVWQHVLCAFYENKIPVLTIKGFEVANYYPVPSLRTMGEYAFSNCALLKSIEIPKGIEFTGCTGLSDIVIPDSVRWFGDSAFEKCSSLKSINITDSVTSIGCDAFSGCRFEEVHISSLEHWLNIDARCALQGDYYINEELLTDVVIPENTSNLRPYAFSGCSSLSSIELGNGIKAIQYGTFEK